MANYGRILNESDPEDANTTNNCDDSDGPDVLQIFRHEAGRGLAVT